MKELFLPGTELKVINVGTARFGKAISAQGVEVRQVKWRPPVIRVLDQHTEKILKLMGM